jgi:hypothetical protein
MRITRTNSLVFPVLALLSGALLVVFAGNPPKPGFKIKPAVLLYPPQMIAQFTFGYAELAADILWIRVVQDFDLCDQSNTALSRPQLPPALGGKQAQASRCNESWVYHMIDSITEMAPKFRIPYETGATMLSILVDDRIGAQKIFEKGVKRFPTNWKLHYGLGYHYLYEIQDVPAAAREIALAAENGAPAWVYALAGKLYSKSGQAEVGISVLKDALSKVEEGPDAERIKMRLNQLETQLAKAQQSEKAN